MPANTQPIYPNTIIQWRATLINQVVPRIITTQSPVKLGTAGDFGAIIHSIDVQPLGDNVATTVRIYTLESPETTPILQDELSIPGQSGSNDATSISRLTFSLPDILPLGNKGLHLSSGMAVYCALGTAIATGLIVRVRGGNY